MSGWKADDTWVGGGQVACGRALGGGMYVQIHRRGTKWGAGQVCVATRRLSAFHTTSHGWLAVHLRVWVGHDWHICTPHATSPQQSKMQRIRATDAQRGVQRH
jgi:hypothetical protein